MDIVILLATLVSGSIVFSVVELIRRNRLKEKYSLLWLVSSLVILFFSVSRKSLESISLFVGIQYPPSFIFLLASLFLIVINIHFSTVISELSERNKILTQEVAILKESMKKDEAGRVTDKLE
jgi:hypothetical protein